MPSSPPKQRARLLRLVYLGLGQYPTSLSECQLSLVKQYKAGHGERVESASFSNSEPVVFVASSSQYLFDPSMLVSSLGALCVSMLGLVYSLAAATPTVSHCENIPTPSATPKSSFICNKQGTVQDQAYLGYFMASDIRPCYNYCLGDTYCTSFAYNTSDSYCRVFHEPIIGKNFTPSTSSGTFYYNKRGCFLQATCQPNAPFQFVGSGGFEDSTLDFYGNYQAGPWYLYQGAGLQSKIQKARGSGHSKFSLSVDTSSRHIVILLIRLQEMY
jgi:hypothetical protein